MKPVCSCPDNGCDTCRLYDENVQLNAEASRWEQRYQETKDKFEAYLKDDQATAKDLIKKIEDLKVKNIVLDSKVIAATEGLKEICKRSVSDLNWESDGKDFGVAKRTLDKMEAMK